MLFVAQLAPPSTMVAARRVAGFSKYLGQRGHRVVVLTSAVSGEGPVEGAARVVRTRDLVASAFNWRRSHLEALTGSSSATYAEPSRLQSVVVPDLAALTWLPFALPRALRLARQERPDCVITTSPPQSGHWIGRALKRRGVPWIADLRDGWTFEPSHDGWPTEAQRAVDRRLERATLSAADAVVGVTRPIVEDARGRLGLEAVLITNGFDPAETPASAHEDGLLDPARHSLVHTGRMAAGGSRPDALLDALRVLRHEAPAVADRLEVVFAGPLTADEGALLGDPLLAGVVKVVGALDRSRALSLQRAADSLLVLTEGESRPSVATGKLFEYLAAGKPVLVLGETTEAARIVTEAGAGIVAPADDAAAIAEALRGIVESPPPGATKEAAAPYAYDALTAQLDELIEDVCV